jgi:hypothetical protein
VNESFDENPARQNAFIRGEPSLFLEKSKRCQSNLGVVGGHGIAGLFYRQHANHQRVTRRARPSRTWFSANAGALCFFAATDVRT